MATYISDNPEEIAKLPFVLQTAISGMRFRESLEESMRRGIVVDKDTGEVTVYGLITP